MGVLDVDFIDLFRLAFFGLVLGYSEGEHLFTRPLQRPMCPLGLFFGAIDGKFEVSLQSS